MSPPRATTRSTVDAWMPRVGDVVAVLRDDHRPTWSVPARTVLRIGKRDIVLDDGTRFKVSDLSREEQGKYARRVFRLLPNDDPRVLSARERASDYVCCPNDAAPIRCANCRKQQRVHLTTCGAPPPRFYVRNGKQLCAECRDLLPGRPAVPRQIREAVIARDGLTCQICRRSVVRRSTREPYSVDTMHLDHIVLWSQGGTNVLGNLRVACAECNLSRPKWGQE